MCLKCVHTNTGSEWSAVRIHTYSPTHGDMNTYAYNIASCVFVRLYDTCVRCVCVCVLICMRASNSVQCVTCEWVCVCIILLCALVCVCFFFGMPFQNLFHSIPFRIFLPVLSVFLTILFWSCNDENQQVASHLVCTQQRARTHRAAQFALFIYLVDAAVDAVALVHFLDIFITIIV